MLGVIVGSLLDSVLGTLEFLVVGWLVRDFTGCDESCLTGDIVGNGELLFVGARLPSIVGRSVDIIDGSLVGRCVGIFVVGIIAGYFVGSIIIDGSLVGRYVGIFVVGIIAGSFVGSIIIDGALVGRYVGIFVFGIIAGSFVGSIVGGPMILVGALVCTLDGRSVKDGSVGRLDGELVFGSFVGAFVGNPLITMGVSVREIDGNDVAMGLSLGCEVGCGKNSPVGVVLEIIMVSIDGRKENVLLGLALGSSFFCEIGDLDG
jgi:hypothetical protein